MTVDTHQNVTEAKAQAARLLLAFRHGNQRAFDDSLPGERTETRELIATLVWIANEAVDKVYLPGVADRVLRRLASRSPDAPGWVPTDEEAAPHVALLLESVRRQDTHTVGELVSATPDTTFLLGKLLDAVARLLPLVPERELRRVIVELRGGTPPAPRGHRC
ncbi:hypothetical protein [Streptomyces caatingaensis]|uniref:Uncharacterized protein n=1 Tax=Streptomyces caatingaensis TaxID=1678637 RepID=A0A0K9XM77_9ACTN|nr:hypothetical protein [Streptomyces caatingaensis]KNB53807.1 hypothetical protein AC230_04220 [Streptomyces caatingaensis]